MQRNDGRGPDEIRSINFELNVAPHASGSVLVSMGQTRVICGITIEEVVPRWMKEQGVTGGWLTAEYSMLPYSTQPRKPRDVAKGRLDGLSVEVQGSGEEATFSGSQLDEMLALAREGIAGLIGTQRAVLARIMVSPPES